MSTPAPIPAAPIPAGAVAVAPLPATPRPQAAPRPAPLLEARAVTRVYSGRSGLWGRAKAVRAVEEVSLQLAPGETLGIVGESGSGKSTLGRMLLGIDPCASGEVRFDGQPMPRFASPEWRRLRAQMQLVYQDPLAALDRRLPLLSQIAEPLEIHRLAAPAEARDRARALMEQVGLRADLAGRYPHEISGGQRQRVVIARALALNPRLLVCDEPVSALDVSIQAQVVNLLRDLQEKHGLAMVFISHDLKVVRNICDRVAVMYLGRIVEEAPSAQIFTRPWHPYTQALVSSVPDPGTRLSQRILLQGEPPNPANRPTGCAFHPRCPQARAECASLNPALAPRGPARRAACHLQPEALRPLQPEPLS